MTCPHCKKDDNYVYCGKFDTKLGGYIRYRTCTVCGQNFKTVERVYNTQQKKESKA